MAMHVIICGGRDTHLTPDDLAWLEGQAQALPITRVYHGAAPGIDTEASAWAVQAGIAVEATPAEWDAHRPDDPFKTNPAGVIRNNRLLKRLRAQAGEEAIAVLAFPGGRGTAHLVQRATKLGIHIIHAPAGDVRPLEAPRAPV